LSYEPFPAITDNDLLKE